MSSLIVNQVKTNMYFSFNYLFIVLTIIIITITACPIQLFAILLTTATVSLELHAQLITRLLQLQLTVTRFVCLFYICTPSVCRTISMWKVHDLAFQRSLMLKLVHCLTCLYLMLTVASLGVRCIYQCIFAYILPFSYVAFALSISLILILMLLLVNL